MNNLTVVGNTTKPTIYREKDKTQLVSISVAVNYRYKDQKRAYFVDVVFFGAMAKVISDFKLETGSLIYVSGELQVEEWTNEEGRVFKNLKIMGSSFNIIKRNKAVTEGTKENTNIDFPGEKNTKEWKTGKSEDLPF